MDFKLKLEEVINLNQTLKQIIDDNTISDVSLKFKLLTILKSLEPHIQNFQIIREQKIVEYGSKDENGNIVIAKDDVQAIEKFTTDMESLISTDVIITVSKLKQDDVFNKGLTSQQLIGIYNIIEN